MILLILTLPVCALGVWVMITSLGEIEMRDIDEDGHIQHDNE